MSSLIKYRVHEVAKDFRRPTKEITDILTKYATTPKNHMQVLEDGELSEDIIALTALLDKSGELSRYFSAYEKKALKARLKEIKENPQVKAFQKVLEDIDNLFVLLIVAAT